MLKKFSILCLCLLPAFLYFSLSANETDNSNATLEELQLFSGLSFPSNLLDLNIHKDDDGIDTIYYVRFELSDLHYKELIEKNNLANEIENEHRYIYADSLDAKWWNIAELPSTVESASFQHNYRGQKLLSGSKNSKTIVYMKIFEI